MTLFINLNKNLLMNPIFIYHNNCFNSMIYANDQYYIKFKRKYLSIYPYYIFQVILLKKLIRYADIILYKLNGIILHKIMGLIWY